MFIVAPIVCSVLCLVFVLLFKFYPSTLTKSLYLLRLSEDTFRYLRTFKEMHFVHQSRTVCAILVECIMRKISVKLFRNL